MAADFWNIRCPSCLNVLGVSRVTPDFVVYCDEFCAEDHKLSTAEDRDALVEHLNQAGLSPSEIARQMSNGLTRQSVTSILRRRRLG